ncbi:ATP-binding protein [Neisseria sp. Dent CA1/247]|uniref:BbrUII/HgiDII family restriction enzyme n=1 Tax=Neisseria sp. Dent CA1/247 TaxID=2912675 RepID=UPI001FD1D480|nr:ATP-binding protein [Neisseria sp. Dent CA1/247]UOO76506.1 ATP-binding protein [Neisseria sp. Dent CA1/247]
MSKYQMTVDLNVLEHLGINLYSNLSAVLTEIVANAWDADAENVAITVDENRPCQFIEIHDDGKGMTIDEMNRKYLTVGYRRRSDDQDPYGKITAKGRPVMGRKGLGKLALFSIADQVKIQSIGQDNVAHGLRMSVDKIREAISRGQNNYEPISLPESDISIQRGTHIRLDGINKNKLSRTISSLKKRLARRFSVLSDNFTVTINGQKVTLSDRDDLEKSQFIWIIEGTNLDTSGFKNIKEQDIVPNHLESWETGEDGNPDWKITGWIGTAEVPKQLDSPDIGNLNSIVVLSRGRLFHENILDKLNDGRLYTKYLTGQIEADFLDTDNNPDIATSDRQRIQEDDPRYKALLAFMRSTLSQVERTWSERRKRHAIAEVQNTSPALQAWIDGLPKGYKKNAEELIATLHALPVDNVNDKKTLYKHGVLAFERMRLRTGDATRVTESVQSIDKLIELFADRDELETSLYGDIVRSRLDTIKNFLDLVNDDQKEKVLQQYLFDHLWLLDPSWEKVENTAIMESRLLKSGIKVDTLSDKEALSRVDIAYRTTAKKHLIIELKKVSRNLTIFELAEQGRTYVRKLKKILLETENNPSPNIEVIFVIGKPLEDEERDPESIKHFMNGVSPGSRIVHYDSLIENAQKSYQDYLNETEKLNKLDQILDNI